MSGDTELLILRFLLVMLRQGTTTESIQLAEDLRARIALLHDRTRNVGGR